MGGALLGTANSSTQKKLSSAHQLRRAAQEDLIAILANGLSSSRRMHSDRRSHVASGYSGDCGRARSCARRLRFANSALEKACSHVMLAVDGNKFYIHTLRKVGAALDFGRTQLANRVRTRRQRSRSADYPSTPECRALRRLPSARQVHFRRWLLPFRFQTHTLKRCAK